MTDAGRMLRRFSEADLLRIASAGSVDDGKSTLLGRLLHDARAIHDDQLARVEEASLRIGGSKIDYAFVLDGLKAEREQGITIDVAYRSFATERRRFLIADTPGHEQYTRNMVTAASTADLALLLVDARSGVRDQTKRHAYLASLLGIRHFVVVVNKMDLVGYAEDAFERIRTEFSDFAERLQVPDVTFIPASAIHGENVVASAPSMPWYGGLTLLKQLESAYAPGARNLVDLRLPVQCVIRAGDELRRYAGQLASGVVSVGDPIVVLPSGRASRVRSIETSAGSAQVAFAGQSVAVTLADEIDVGRGDVLVGAADPPAVTSEIDADLVWLCDRPLDPARTYVIKHGTCVTRAQIGRPESRVDPLELRHEAAASLALNDVGRVRLETVRPLVVDAYRRIRGTGSFIVIDPTTNVTIAAGLIVDPRARSSARVDGAQPVSRNITPTSGQVTRDERRRLHGQSAVTVWFTGLSSSGKSTLAYALERRLVSDGRPCFVLDGDNLRHGLNRDLGFSPEDRRENIRRAAEVAALFNEAGVIAITAFISPYRADRESARAVVGAGRFVEVFVDAPLAVCEERDPKGLYRKARAGQIPEFTGVTAPYEAPLDPAVHVETHRSTTTEGVDRIVAHLRAIGVFP